MTSAPGSLRGMLFLLCVLAFFTFGLMVVRYLNSPLRFDETEFSAQAGGILRHGVPKILLSEDKILHLRPTYLGYDAHYGMWHPPLYLYSLAASAKLLGSGNWPLRGVSLLWFFLSLWIGMRILAFLNGTANLSLERWLWIALVLLTPLLAEGSLFIDIDNTSLTCGLLLFTLIFLKSPKDFSPKRTALLSLLFTLSLWSKLTTPFILLASVLMFHVLNGHWRRGVVQVLLIGFSGTALFLLTYWLYCRVFDYPFRFMFDFTYGTKWERVLAPKSLKVVLFCLRWHVVWMSLPIILSLAITSLLRIRNFLRSRELEKMDFLLVFLILGSLFYLVGMGLIGKYTFPLVFTGLLAASHQMAPLLVAVVVRRPGILGLLVVGLGIFHALFVPALQVRLPGFDLQTATLWQAFSYIRNLYLLATLAAFVVFFLLMRLLNVVGRGAIFVALVGYLLSANPVNAAKVYLSRDDHSPYRSSQDRGFAETVNFLNTHIDRREILLAPKDIGFYFEGRHIPTDAPRVFRVPMDFQGFVRSSKILFIVDSEKFPTLKRLKPFLGEGGLIPQKRIGDFVIYKTPSGLKPHAADLAEPADFQEPGNGWSLEALRPKADSANR